MIYKIDKDKFKAARKNSLTNGYIRIGVGYLIFGFVLFKIAPIDLMYKIIIFILIGLIGYFLDKWLLIQVDKKLMTLEIELNEASIIKSQLGQVPDMIELKNIKSIQRIKSGLVIEAYSKKKLFIPAVIEKIDEIENALKK